MCFCFTGTGVEAKRVGDFQVRGCSVGEVWAPHQAAAISFCELGQVS